MDRPTTGSTCTSSRRPARRSPPCAGFRDALRADPLLRRRYAALKRVIVADGPVDPVAFTKAKHDWIVATLDQLGLGSHQHYRLYEDDPRLATPHQLAS
jgi:hypothetical protein